MEGTPFGRYRLLELLGRGGMGEVWRAYDTETSRVVAVKLLPPHLAQDVDFQRRFRREALAAASLNEPHVVPIHHFGEIDGRLYVDMRLIEGRDLDSVLRDGPLPPERAVSIVGQIASALGAAHRIGLVHRDIKPSNVLMVEDDFAYLIDFGIARAAGQTGLTLTGATVGTWAYMAPERFGSGEVDPRIDVYALACVLFQCVTGRPPFVGGTMEQQVAGHLMTPPPKPSEVVGTIPAALDAVVEKGMAKDPEQRYASTKALAAAARDAVHPGSAPRANGSKTVAVMGNSPLAPRTRVDAPPTSEFGVGDVSRPPPPRPWWRRRVPLALASMVLVVIVVGVAAGLLVTRGAQSTAPTQSTLPFAGVTYPAAVAVGPTGTVYVADSNSDRIVMLAKGSDAQRVVPFAGLDNPLDVAVGADGVVYVADTDNSRVLKVAAPGPQTVVAFDGLGRPVGLAVDAAGAVYVADTDNRRVMMLAAGATAQTELPLPGLERPVGVAVSRSGAVYVSDSRNARVVALAAGSRTQTELPFSGLDQPGGVAVDSSGAVYVADTTHDRVLKLAAGSSTQEVVPFSGLDQPGAVAVDSSGAVYVTESRTGRVLALTPPTT